MYSSGRRSPRESDGPCSCNRGSTSDPGSAKSARRDSVWLSAHLADDKPDIAVSQLVAEPKDLALQSPHFRAR
jgi:hypothetical protein